MKLASLSVMIALAVLAGCKVRKGPDGSLELGRALSRPTPAQCGIDALSHEDADRRREAIIRLARSREGFEPTYVKVYAVIAGNQDEEPTVRAAAVEALGRSGDPRHVDRVLLCLEDPDQQLRIDAARALCRLHADTALDALIRHGLSDPNDSVRAYCAEAMGHYRHRAALDALIACLNDRQFGVRHAARSSLRRLTGLDGGGDGLEWRRLLKGQDDPFIAPPPPLHE